jgi:hypothetical protein
VPVSAFATLRPFPLPMPDQSLQLGGHEDEKAPTRFQLALRPREDVLQPPRCRGERPFHRWVLGHRIAFGVWRMLIDLLGSMLREGATEPGLLVPNGKSLLKQAGRKPSGPTTDSERDQFDTFFIIERCRVHTGQFRAHMLEKLASARCDLASHPITCTGFHGIENLLSADVPTYLRDIAIDLIALPRLETHCTSINTSV